VKHITERRYPVAEVSNRLGVSQHSLYEWVKKYSQPEPARREVQSQQENQRLLGLIKQSWLESGSVYGYRKIADDLRDLGERCGNHGVYRLMRTEELRSQTGYRRRPGQRYGRPSVVLDPFSR